MSVSIANSMKSPRCPEVWWVKASVEGVCERVVVDDDEVLV